MVRSHPGSPRYPQNRRPCAVVTGPGRSWIRVALAGSLGVSGPVWRDREHCPTRLRARAILTDNDSNGTTIGLRLERTAAGCSCSPRLRAIPAVASRPPAAHDASPGAQPIGRGSTNCGYTSSDRVLGHRARHRRISGPNRSPERAYGTSAGTGMAPTSTGAPCAAISAERPACGQAPANPPRRHGRDRSACETGSEYPRGR